MTLNDRINRIRDKVDGVEREITKRKQFYFVRKININKHMTDAEYQAGMTAAIQAYQSSLNGAYGATGFSYTYTPPMMATPPAETVTVSF